MTVKILMVDDEPDAELLFRQNFRREMRKEEYQFLFAQSGQQALELLEFEEIPEVLLVLSDINMPGMNGIELLDEVKKKWPHLPVFMVTAYGDPKTEYEAKKKGAHMVVPKPVDFANLKETISEFMAQSS